MNGPERGKTQTRLRLTRLLIVGLVLNYIRMQLGDRKSTFDKIFEQQNTPEVEEHRRKQLQVDQFGDPRRSMFNVMGWK